MDKIFLARTLPSPNPGPGAAVREPRAAPPQQPSARQQTGQGWGPGGGGARPSGVQPTEELDDSSHGVWGFTMHLGNLGFSEGPAFTGKRSGLALLCSPPAPQQGKLQVDTVGRSRKGGRGVYAAGGRHTAGLQRGAMTPSSTYGHARAPRLSRSPFPRTLRQTGAYMVRG